MPAEPDDRHAPAAFFIADSRGLDFLNSVAVPGDTQIDWLTSGEDLLAWLKQADLVPGDVLDAFRESAIPGELDGVAAQARALRDWFRQFVDKHRGKPLEPAALRELEPLNRLLAREEEFGQITLRPDHDRSGQAATKETSLVWRPQRRWRSPESLLLPLARALADLVCTEDFAQVKACEGNPCTLLFIDRTRSHGRRWCSMAICGNRAKQATHRNRLKTHG